MVNRHTRLLIALLLFWASPVFAGTYIINPYSIGSGADTTAPTLTTVAVDGTTWTYNYSESVTADTTAELCNDYTGTWTTAGAVTQTYSSGDSTSTVTCTGSASVGAGDTLTNGLDYLSGSGSIEDLAATPNALATMDDKAVTNNSASTPDVDYDLDAAGGTGSAQVYDDIAAAWKGGGADTADFSSGYLEANSTSDRCYVPGSEFEYSTTYTIRFEYQVSDASNVNLYAFYYSSGGDALTFHHYNSSGIGRFGFKSGYDGTPPSLDFDNSGLSADTWYEVYIVIDPVGEDMYLYHNGSLADSEIDNSDIEDLGTLAGSFYVGYVYSGTDTVRVRNLKIYDGEVTP